MVPESNGENDDEDRAFKKEGCLWPEFEEESYSDEIDFIIDENSDGGDSFWNDEVKGNEEEGGNPSGQMVPMENKQEKI